MTTTPPPSDETPLTDHFDDVLEAAAVLAELPDVARVEAWASSALGVWGEAPDAAEIDAEFIAWLTHGHPHPHPHAHALLVAISGLLQVDDDTIENALAAIRAEFAWAGHMGPAEPIRAWTVAQRGVMSVGIGFTLGDASQYSILADIVDDTLESLIVAPGPEELFDGSEDLVAPQPMDPRSAATVIVDAWRRLVEADGAWPESVFVNAAVAHRRLGDMVGQDLTALFRPAWPQAQTRDVDTGDRAELNAWALSVLDGAGVGSGTAGAAVLLDSLDPARIGEYPAAEREAFNALEWADWLGVAIGLSRAEPGLRVDPSTLVDLVNRCPEVTSTIPKNDRPYFEWAFSLVLPLWRRANVIDGDGALTEHGARYLVHALRSAWG